MTYAQLFRTSRPRFWIYLLGPFLVGHAIALGEGFLTSPFFWIFAGYFTFPANIFVYGINDIYDYETDKHNPKKRAYEELITPDRHESLAKWILYANAPFIILSALLPPLAQLAFVLFLVFSWQYSAPPVRAKTTPFVDSFFNVLYVFPGLVGLFSYVEYTFSWELFVAATLWVMAMHAYSAIPDIETDRTAGISTVATFLNAGGTLIFCTILYGLSYLLIVPVLGIFAHLLGGVYLGMMLLTAVSLNRLFRMYTLFPWLNTIMGFLLFVYAIL